MDSAARLAALTGFCGTFSSIDPLAGREWVARNPVALTPEAAEQRRATRRSGMVGVLPLYGVLSQHASPFDEMLGASSLVRWAQAFRSLVADPQISGIVIDVDSPGGIAFGNDALSAEVHKARARKPIVAVASGMNASAAYDISSGATEIWADADSLTGSIGVIFEHVDVSQALENEGVKVTAVTYGKYKAEIAPYAPLADEALDYLQGMANQFGEMFVSRVAKNRGLTDAKVRSTFGQGRVFTAKDALAIGMVDRVGTLEQAVSYLGSSAASPSDTGAMRQLSEAVEASGEALVEYAAAVDLETPTPPTRDLRWRERGVKLAIAERRYRGSAAQEG